MTMKRIEFKAFTAEILKDSERSLNRLGKYLESNEDLSIHIIAYQKNDRDLAKVRAIVIREYLLNEFPEIQSPRLKTSWFDVSEEIKIGKKSFKQEEFILK